MSLPASDFRLIPIPPAVTDGSALDYHLLPIDTSGAANREPLVEVSSLGIAHRSAYAQKMAPYYRTFNQAVSVPLLREGVVQRLALVNQALEPYDVQLLVLDGYRPVLLQQELWDHFIEIARGKMPDSSDEELVKFVGQYWSDPRDFNPDDYRTWPTHITGGAIDLTLQDKLTGQDLFMGGVFDDVDSISSTRYFENPALTSLSALDARRNRRLLHHAMAIGGFVNYHHEWWHYDFGMQMAIMNGSGAEQALYGIAACPLDNLKP
ncbi:MAG: hypothetical protein IAF58_22495 [Leptolyngbya sp.]|nr:hypothetical protein [Candidatus Melainabacteria bacterium]